MKNILLLLAVSGGIAAGAAGQTNRTDLINGRPATPQERPERNLTFAPASDHHIFGAEVRFGGALPDLLRANKPPSRVSHSPAVAENDEFPNLSRNPVTGKADGISLFAIKF